MAFQPTLVELCTCPPPPKVSKKEEQDAYVPENYHVPDDTVPNLETYMYYAKIQRDREVLSTKNDAEGGHWGSLISRIFNRSQESDERSVASAHSDEKNVAPSSEDGSGALVTAGEYRAASGALRTATWGTVFYLITTGKLIDNFDNFDGFYDILRKTFWVLSLPRGHSNKLDMVLV